jgi:hypothetical protein
MTSSARSSTTTSGRKGAFRDPAADRHTADRALDDLRHTRWRAFDEHLSRRLCRTWPRGRGSGRGGGSKVTYFEGYLWDPPRAKDAIRLCAEIGHKHGREMSMTLSDPFCVDRYRNEFLELMRSGTIDIVFANADEAKSLYQTDNFEHAVAQLRKDCNSRDHPLRTWIGHRPRR